MEKVKRRYWIYWFNLIFLVANTAFFVFTFMGSGQRKTDERKIISNEFLRKELKLSDAQYTSLCEMDSKVQERYERVLKLLCRNRYRLMSELAKPQPSVEQLNKLAKSIGFMHAALKTQTSRHLLNIKKICDPEQSRKLEQIFKELLEIDAHCVECKSKCSQEEKCKKSPKFCPYREELKDSLENFVFPGKEGKNIMGKAQ